MGDANTNHARSLSLPVTQASGHSDLNSASFNSSTTSAVIVIGWVRADALWLRKGVGIPEASFE